MSNLDVALAGFWQIARHWKKGDKAKLELSCEAGSLHLQLSAMLGHPDQPHFPHPSPPPSTSSCKRKSPSQLRRQDRRRKEAVFRVDETAKDLVKETAAKPSEKNTEKDAHATEKLPDSEKNYVSDQKKGMQATYFIPV